MLVNQQIGELSLSLYLAAKQRSPELLKEALRELGLYCTEKEGKWAFTNANSDLHQRDRDWLKGQMLKLYSNCAAQTMPYTAYLWRSTESVSLKAVVTLRLNEQERSLLDQRAKAEGSNRCDYARKLIREALSARQ